MPDRPSIPSRDMTRQTVRFYWRHVTAYRAQLIGLAVGIPLTVFTYSFLPPLLLAEVLRRLSREDFTPGNVWASFGPELLLYTGLVLFGGVVLWRVVDFFAWRLEANVVRDIARQVYDHLLHQSARFHSDTFGGSLVSQTNKLQNGYVRIADTTIYQVAPLASSLVFAVIIMGRRAPFYVAILVGFAALYIMAALIITRRVRRLSAEHAAYESRQTGYLADSITNVMAIKSFAGGEYERQRFAEVTDTTRASLLQLMRAFNRQQIYFTTITNIILAVSLAAGVVSVVVYGANIGTIFLIITYTATIVTQLFTFSNNSLRNYNRSLGDASDMVAILSQTPEVLDPAKPQRPRISRGAIDFNRVVFSHEGGGDDALFDGLDLHIKAGERIGLIGRSGSGKTTLTRILLRFDDIDGGSITIDGQPIDAITQDALRDHIAYVPQEPLLFHRSLRDNIRYGRGGASDKAVTRVSKLAHADDFIRSLADGYDTLVGERGVKLSGGQRQRVAIARALLKDAPIIVLDEATSALDSESEAYIQEALWELMKGRTAIVVAHRLSTIQRMDRIVVMDAGRIIEQGTHRQLLKAKGVYADLWARQSGGFIEA